MPILFVQEIYLKDQMRKDRLNSYFLKVFKKSLNPSSPTLVEVCNINKTTLLVYLSLINIDRSMISKSKLSRFYHLRSNYKRSHFPI